MFQKHFAGREVGFEEMVAEQQRLWPPRKCPIGWPLCWDASRDLGNAMHVDSDGWRSYAWWGRTGCGAALEALQLRLHLRELRHGVTRHTLGDHGWPGEIRF